MDPAGYAPSPTYPQQPPPPRNRKLLIAVLVAVGVMAIVGGAVVGKLTTSQHGEEQPTTQQEYTVEQPIAEQDFPGEPSITAEEYYRSIAGTKLAEDRFTNALEEAGITDTPSATQAGNDVCYMLNNGASIEKVALGWEKSAYTTNQAARIINGAVTFICPQHINVLPNAESYQEPWVP